MAVAPTPPPNPQSQEDKQLVEELKMDLALGIMQGPGMTFKSAPMNEALMEDDPDYSPPPLEFNG